MSEAVVAKRYAEALFQLGQEKNTLDDLIEQFGIVSDVFKNNEQLYTFLEHPRINNEKKKQFIQDVFQGLQTDVINTMKLLVDRHRTEITPSIINYFTQMVNDAKAIAEATVHSVRKLSDTETQQLADRLAAQLDKETVNITNVVDPEIIGGLRIRIGNTIFDGSIRGKLARMERRILTANK